jgi:hypothetical protein
MGRPAIDLTGQRFGKLIVLEKADKPKHLKNSSIYWLCKCDCGGTIIGNSSDLRKGYLKSCGCLRFNNLTGQKFGRLTALYIDYKTPKNNGGSLMWLCKCDCGNIKTIDSHSLVSGGTKSCGCLHDEIAALNLNVKNRSPKVNIIGGVFGKLTVIKELDNGKWLCECECGNKTEVKTGNLIYGGTKSCGCLHSSGEEIISKILTKYNIEYSKQYTFPEWKNTNYWRYRYDFVVYNEGAVQFIIEYDGFHHFGFNDNNWNTGDNHFQTIVSDNYKSNYCAFKGIPLLRIPYWELDDIEDILIKWLNNFIFKGVRRWQEKQMRN